MSGQHNQRLAVTELFNVTDWVVVVTGGGTGIGLMIAQGFANNGARVYIVGRRLEVLEDAVKTWGHSLVHAKGKIIPIQGDVSEKEGIQMVVEAVKRSEDHVDVLVNNAGINATDSSQVEKGDDSAQGLYDELWKQTEEEWMQIYKTNVIGHFFTAIAFLPLLTAASKAHSNHSGTVIDISSVSGIMSITQHHPQYNASKAALIQLTRHLAQEFKRPGVGVRVNGIAPGLFPSEMTAGSSDATNKSDLSTSEDQAQKKGIPAGRPGCDEDMAQVALMLATNQYMYGQIVTVDGGVLLVRDWVMVER
ncbi:NAD(P)-binding protein [Mucidula mucida]|nr:NAD(P)-binding protein [Mucidula mucida]